MQHKYHMNGQYYDLEYFARFIFLFSDASLGKTRFTFNSRQN